MSGFKKSSIPGQCSYNSLYLNPLTEIKHNWSSSTGTTDSQSLGVHMGRIPLRVNEDKENAEPNKIKNQVNVGKENAVPSNGLLSPLAKAKHFPNGNSNLKDRVLRPSSLQLCMQMNEPDSTFGSKIWDPIDSDNSNSVNIWDYSDSEAAPASSWSTIPNRSMLCRPLPLDIGRCTCVIVKEASPEGLNGGTLFALYTNVKSLCNSRDAQNVEGQGRQNRKLAVAHHKRHNGRSEFTVAQNTKGLLCSSDDSFVGTVTANLMGSKYQIWNDQGRRLSSTTKLSKLLLAVVTFTPTIATWTGSYRSMKAWIPKHQSMQLKTTTQASKQYELDFRERGRSGLKIQSSVKNFQLTLEEKKKEEQKLKSLNSLVCRYPLTGYQAFSICLAAMDSKLCCTV
ncbi:hypothetical protein LguiA_028467 [Lonicera macranthoides]